MLLLCACGKKSEVWETDGAGLVQMETPGDGSKESTIKQFSENIAEGQKKITDSENEQQSTGNGDGATTSEQFPEELQTDSVSSETGFSRIYVYICGAVITPDVYALPEGSRVYEAVQLAGGLADDADADQVNLAVVLSDGQKVRIPRKGEKLSTAQMLEDGSAGIYGSSTGAGVSGTGVSDGGSDGMGSAVGGVGSGAAGSGGLVNINTAGKEELMTLNGIGSTRAEAILQYRERHGAFQSPRDLLKVSGIKEKTYEKIKGQISIE